MRLPALTCRVWLVIAARRSAAVAFAHHRSLGGATRVGGQPEEDALGGGRARGGDKDASADEIIASSRLRSLRSLRPQHMHNILRAGCLQCDECSERAPLRTPKERVLCPP